MDQDKGISVLLLICAGNSSPRLWGEECYTPPGRHKGQVSQLWPPTHHCPYLWLGHQPSLHKHWFQRNVIFRELLDKLKVPLFQVKHSSGPPFGIGRDAILLRKSLPIMAEFLQLDLPFSFNVIIDWPSQLVFNLRATFAPSSLHLKLRGATPSFTLPAASL